MYSPVVWVTWEDERAIRTAAFVLFTYRKEAEHYTKPKGEISAYGWGQEEYDHILANDLTDDEGRQLIKILNQCATLSIGWKNESDEGVAGGQYVVDINRELEKIRNKHK